MARATMIFSAGAVAESAQVEADRYVAKQGVRLGPIADAAALTFERQQCAPRRTRARIADRHRET